MIPAALPVFEVSLPAELPNVAHPIITIICPEILIHQNYPLIPEPTLLKSEVG
jgi:hypothetical protein